MEVCPSHWCAMEWNGPSHLVYSPIDVVNYAGDSPSALLIGSYPSRTEREKQKSHSNRLLPDGHQPGLKVIIHYGSVSIFQIGQFTKLYGTSIIEAHRLLKNSIGKKHYLLVIQS